MAFRALWRRTVKAHLARIETAQQPGATQPEMPSLRDANHQLAKVAPFQQTDESLWCSL
ncbi:MAG: hypothetical protein IKE42_00175 [Aquamicrobium sp.]|nr:hypothetical protein [Aquamicrobium sp.]